MKDKITTRNDFSVCGPRDGTFSAYLSI